MNTLFPIAVQANTSGQEVISGLTLPALVNHSGEFESALLAWVNLDETAQNDTGLKKLNSAATSDSDSKVQFQADMLSLLAPLLTPGRQDFTPAGTGNEEKAAAGEIRLPSDPVFHAARAADTWHFTMQAPLSPPAPDEVSPASLLRTSFQVKQETSLSVLSVTRHEMPVALDVPELQTELTDFAPNPILSEVHTKPFTQGLSTEKPEIPSAVPIPEVKSFLQQPDPLPVNDVKQPDQSLPYSIANLAEEGASPAFISESDTVRTGHSPVFRQIADYLERLVRLPGEDSIRIQLDPPELGALDITVRVQGNEVQAQVTAEQDTTRQMIEQTIEQLRQMMEERGLQLSQFQMNKGGAFQQKPEQDRQSPQDQQKEPANSTARSRVWEINPSGQWSVWI